MKKYSVLYFALMLLVTGVPAFAQHWAGGTGFHGYSSFYRSAPYSYRATPYYPSWGSYGVFYPAFGGPGLYGNSSSPLDVPPRYWWVSPYPSENPCQAGCNPNAGYEWDSVGTLILDTNPPSASVTLDGVLAGTTDRLGPFQLPVGRHTLHVQFPGFEPSDVIVKFDEPGVQSLRVELKRLAALAKPAP